MLNLKIHPTIIVITKNKYTINTAIYFNEIGNDIQSLITIKT